MRNHHRQPSAAAVPQLILPRRNTAVTEETAKSTQTFDDSVRSEGNPAGADHRRGRRRLVASPSIPCRCVVKAMENQVKEGVYAMFPELPICWLAPDALALCKGRACCLSPAWLQSLSARISVRWTGEKSFNDGL